MTDHPRLAASCTFHPFDNGGGREEYVLATADGRQFRVSALARQILRRMDGRTGLEEIARRLGEEDVVITAEQLRTLLEEKYSRLGVIEDGDAPPPGEEPVHRVRRRPGFPILLTLTLIPQRAVAALAGLLRHLYAPVVALPLLAWIVWSHAGVYGAELDVARLTPESYLWITCWCLLSIVVHELGHAAAVARFGGQPGAIGCGLYLLLPTFYADVSQLWRFPRRQRMVVDLGGAYFQQLAFAAFAMGALGTADPVLLATCHLIDLMVLTALNPLFHFDGYWFLADYLAIPKLQKTALESLRGHARRLLGRPAALPALPPLGRFARGVYLSYAVLSTVFVVAIFWILFRYLSATLLRVPQVAPQAVELAAAALRSGDVAQIFVQSMTLFFLFAFPLTALVGVVLLLARGVRSLAERVSRRSLEAPSQGG